MRFLTYTVPKFIKRNELDEHKYLFPFFMVVSMAIISVSKQIGFSTEMVCIAALMPFLYDLYLIFNLSENEYDFDLIELNLSEKASKFVQKTANTYRDEIRFYAHKITTDALSDCGEEERISLLKEINDSIKNHKTDLSVVFMGHTYGTDMKNVDRHLVEMFIKNVDAYFTHESLLSIQTIGVKI